MKKCVVLISLLVLSCNNDDICDSTLSLPPAPTFQIAFEDSNGNSLIGTTFVQDSFKLYNAAETIYLKPVPFGPQDQLQVRLPEIVSGSTYFLELDDTDSDTLKIDHFLKESTCFDLLTLESFSYNNAILYQYEDPESNDLFVITKE